MRLPRTARPSKRPRSADRRPRSGVAQTIGTQGLAVRPLLRGGRLRYGSGAAPGGPQTKSHPRMIKFTYTRTAPPRAMRIRIVRVPAGDAPEEVREAWVG